MQTFNNNQMRGISKLFLKPLCLLIFTGHSLAIVQAAHEKEEEIEQNVVLSPTIIHEQEVKEAMLRRAEQYTQSHANPTAQQLTHRRTSSQGSQSRGPKTMSMSDLQNRLAQEQEHNAQTVVQKDLLPGLQKLHGDISSTSEKNAADIQALYREHMQTQANQDSAFLKLSESETNARDAEARAVYNLNSALIRTGELHSKGLRALSQQIDENAEKEVSLTQALKYKLYSTGEMQEESLRKLNDQVDHTIETENKAAQELKEEVQNWSEQQNLGVAQISEQIEEAAIIQAKDFAEISDNSKAAYQAQLTEMNHINESYQKYLHGLDVRMDETAKRQAEEFARTTEGNLQELQSMNAALAEKGEKQTKELGHTEEERLALVSEINEDISKREKEREQLSERLAREAEEDFLKTLQLLQAPATTRHSQQQSQSISLESTTPLLYSNELENSSPNNRNTRRNNTNTNTNTGSWSWWPPFRSSGPGNGSAGRG